MKIILSKKKPDTKPIREYETRFIYVGFRFRYDTHTKMLSSIETHSDESITYTETPCDCDVFSRGYSTENAKVTVYSDSPRIWCEEMSPTDYFVFVQQPTQAA